MDSLTHVFLGGVVGHAIAGKQLGRKAMIIGGLAQSIPDLDVIAGIWLSPVDDLLAHRGITHSFLFAAVTAASLGWLFWKWRAGPLRLSTWILLFAAELFAHDLLDSLNNYGTAWWEPFSHQRVAFNTIFVADPFYTIWSILGCAGIWFSVSPARKFKWMAASLLISNCYLAYGAFNRSYVVSDLKASFQSDGIVPRRLFATPAPFNAWLWFYAAETDSGFYTGYRSVFDRGKSPLNFTPQQADLIANRMGEHDVRQLVRFSEGLYSIARQQDTLVFNDLRFGQVAGWSNPHAPFTFHYYLNYPDANALVVQRGRVQNWNTQTISGFFSRIKGNQGP